MKNWFIHARRNASLHHLSFLMVALHGKGWKPAVDFSVSDVMVAGFARKGGFIYLDKDLLGDGGAGLVSIQKSVDENPDFIQDFRTRTNELFGAVFLACARIDEENRSLLPLPELAKLYRGYISAMLAGPLITVQVYGIEAMVDPTYRIISSLTEKLAVLGKSDELAAYRQIFLTNDGETVPFTERKDFYRICAQLDTPELAELWSMTQEDIEKELSKYPEAAELIEKHIGKYYWVNTEYLGGGWSKAKWLGLFKSALHDASAKPSEELKKLEDSFTASQTKKHEAVAELGLSPAVVHAIDSLGEFLAQRDWTKGYTARSLLSYHKLLAEIAARMGIDFDTVLQYSYYELDAYFTDGTQLSTKELEMRRNEGYAFVVKNGVPSLFSGRAEIDRVLVEEHIENPLLELPPEETIRGMSASRGKATGIAHVIDDASKIPEFRDGEVLVTYMTTIEFTPLFRKAIAVVTDEGGMSCHAAIISREFKLPCIVGTKVATRVVQTGDTIEVDAMTGVVKILERAPVQVL